MLTIAVSESIYRKYRYDKLKNTTVEYKQNKLTGIVYLIDNPEQI